MDAGADRLGAINPGGLVIFSDNVKRCRLKWFGLVWGCQEKGRRIRSKKGGKVARRGAGSGASGLTVRRNASPATTE